MEKNGFLPSLLVHTAQQYLDVFTPRLTAKDAKMKICTSVNKNVVIVMQTMNKKDRNSNVITIHSNFSFFNTFGHHVSQTMNLKRITQGCDGTVLVNLTHLTG
jgi:hypothetical protein